MGRRLVLGCGSVGQTLIEAAADRPGDLYVLTTDAGWVTTLRESNVSAIEADPTAPENYPATADLVIVASDDSTQNATAVSVARDQYPEAIIIAYTGEEADEATTATIRSIADHVIDPVSAVADRVRTIVGGENGRRMADLVSVLTSLRGPLAVVTHDNPDPDAIASALGVTRLAERIGVDADPCYAGEISHQENRALVNLLDIDLRNLEGIDLSTYDGIALVDHSRPGINDSLPEDVAVDIVVDHHPPRGPVEGRYLDIRPEHGSTSSIIAEYYDHLETEPDRQLATALLYGIRIDTRDFTREVHEADFEAAADLVPLVDQDVLERVESPSVTAETMEIIATAIRNRDVRGETLASCVGEVSDRDALAQAAERLLDMDDVAVAFVYGFEDGTVYLSARARGADVDLGESLRDALGQIGSAGGHTDMAGAQVPLGILGEVEGVQTESLADVVEEFIGERLFETFEDPPSIPTHDPGNLLGIPEDVDRETHEE